MIAKGLKKLNAIDDQIKQLELDLLANDSESDESEIGNDDSNNITETLSSKNEEVVDLLVEKDEKGQIVRYVSSLSVEEKISPLPTSSLPQPMCAKGGGGKSKVPMAAKVAKLDGSKSVRFVDHTEVDSSKKSQLKRPRSDPKSSLKTPQVDSSKISGLEATVREMLVNYQPSSAERRPFWCRICRIQSSDINEFESHKKSEMHAVAERMERKMSFCNLCKKQFTSPDQLKEHVKGKSHIERLAMLKARQSSGKQYC